MKSIAEILQSAGEIAGKVESSDPMAKTKAIVRGLTNNFNQGYQRARQPKQMDLFTTEVIVDPETGQESITIKEDYESFVERMRREDENG